MAMAADLGVSEILEALVSVSAAASWFEASADLAVTLGWAFSTPNAPRPGSKINSIRLQTKYDDGVANDTDFFTSTLYDNIVSKTERLDDRYGLFVSGVERSIDRITDLISTTNDDITYFNNLLADYQADTSLSATRLDRIEAWIGRITDRLTTRVDSLTDKQSTLQTNLPTYQTFQTDIDTFLSDIQAAGGDEDGTTSSAVSLTSRSMLVQSALSSDEVTCATSGTSLTPTAAPEPATATLLVLALGAGCVLVRRRSRRRAYERAASGRRSAKLATCESSEPVRVPLSRWA